MQVSGDKLRHALGVHAYRYSGGLRWSKPYRNYFCAGGNDVALFEAMARVGLVKSGRPPSSWEDQVYTVTEVGRAFALKGIEFKRRWGYGQPVNE